MKSEQLIQKLEDSTNIEYDFPRQTATLRRILNKLALLGKPIIMNGTTEIIIRITAQAGIKGVEGRELHKNGIYVLSILPWNTDCIMELAIPYRRFLELGNKNV